MNVTIERVTLYVKNATFFNLIKQRRKNSIKIHLTLKKSIKIPMTPYACACSV